MKVSQKRPSTPPALGTAGEPTGSSMSASSTNRSSHPARSWTATVAGERSTTARISSRERGIPSTTARILPRPATKGDARRRRLDVGGRGPSVGGRNFTRRKKTRWTARSMAQNFRLAKDLGPADHRAAAAVGPGAGHGSAGQRRASLASTAARSGGRSTRLRAVQEGVTLAWTTWTVAPLHDTARLARRCRVDPPGTPVARSSGGGPGPRAARRAADAQPAAPAPAPAAAPASAPAPEGMLLVPAGTFTMGADSGGEEDEHPAHKVTLPAFWLDRTEVTNEAYRACVAAKACRPKSAEVVKRYPHFNGPKQPVSGVSWSDARAYCAWKGQRLPREAEFERAVRGDDGRRYPWGNEPPTKDAHGLRGRQARARRLAVRRAAGPTATTTSRATSGSGWRTSTTPSPTGAPAPARGSPAPARRSWRIQNQLRRAGKAGLHRLQPDPDRRASAPSAAAPTTTPVRPPLA